VGDSARVVPVTAPDAKKFVDDYRAKVNATPIYGWEIRFSTTATPRM